MHTSLALESENCKEHTKEEALALDASDTLQHLRSEFIIPTKDDLRTKTLSTAGGINLTPCVMIQTNG